MDGDLRLRIGIHVRDVVVQGEDLMGDGFNIAARIEGVAEPGGIAISREVHAHVRDRLEVAFANKGEVELKNIARPVHVFAFTGTKALVPSPAGALPDKPSIAVLPFDNMSGDPEQSYFADGLPLQGASVDVGRESRLGEYRRTQQDGGQGDACLGHRGFSLVGDGRRAASGGMSVGPLLMPPEY